MVAVDLVRQRRWGWRPSLFSWICSSSCGRVLLSFPLIPSSRLQLQYNAVNYLISVMDVDMLGLKDDSGRIAPLVSYDNA